MSNPSPINPSLPPSLSKLFLWYWVGLFVAPLLLLIPISKTIELEPPLGPLLMLHMICMTVISLNTALNERHKVRIAEKLEYLQEEVRFLRSATTRNYP